MKKCILSSSFLKPWGIVILGISLIFPGRALAYLDLYTGSYFLQLLLGGLFGVIFALKIYWKKIRAFFTRRFPAKDHDDSKS